MGSRAHALLWLVGLCWAAPDSAAATYHYEAYFAGLRVGSATVVVARDANGYRIDGSAAARGVAAFFSDWRSDFYATGVFAEASPELRTYGFDERERNKHRILNLADGIVEVTRNGNARPPTPALDGLDVLTAFFIVPDCWNAQLVHTGRYNYWIDGSPAKRGGCDFEVEDDDGDRERVYMRFEWHHGHLVPARLSTGRLVKGRVILKRIEPDLPAAHTEVSLLNR